jgi:mRNA interferase MazF
MDTTVKTSIVIQKALFEQAEILAQRLNVSQNDLFELALEHFVSENAPSSAAKTTQTDAEKRVIHQGDVYWLQLDDSIGLGAGIPHPYVVIQDNVLNHSRIHTVVVCAVTSNAKKVNLPGSVLLELGEANLPKQSIVEVSKVSTVDKTRLGEYIGSLSEARIHQILDGMRFLQASFFAR